MVSSLIARLGPFQAIMTHPKLLAPLIPDRKLVWGRVELQASIFALECGRSLKQKTRTPCSSDGKKHRCLQSAQTDTSLGTPDYLSQDPINSFLPLHNKLQVKIKLGNIILPQAETPIFLGATLDSRLSWKPQIESMRASKN